MGVGKLLLGVGKLLHVLGDLFFAVGTLPNLHGQRLHHRMHLLFLQFHLVPREAGRLRPLGRRDLRVLHPLPELSNLCCPRLLALLGLLLRLFQLGFQLSQLCLLFFYELFLLCFEPFLPRLAQLSVALGMLLESLLKSVRVSLNAFPHERRLVALTHESFDFLLEVRGPVWQWGPFLVGILVGILAIDSRRHGLALG